MAQLYTPPPGYYDLPFTWAFDASGLANGAVPALNNSVYIKGGYGQFVLRRIVGLSRILNPLTGQYHIRDGMLNNIESQAVYGVSADDKGMAPELLYSEQNAIRFDLINILKPAPQVATSQIAFQGVRRMAGSPPVNPKYKATPKSFTYTMFVTVNSPVGTISTGRVTIDNYDFELHQLIILKSTATAQLPATITEGDVGQISFFGVPGTTVTVINQAGTPNLPFYISVVGNAVTLGASTDGSGFSIMLASLAPALIAANPAASALISAGAPLGADFPIAGSTVVNPLGASSPPAVITTPVSSLWIYDSNKVQISNMPILDLFCDGAPLGVYRNGAIVTPLWFPKDTQIQIDFYSQLLAGSAGVTVYLVGKKFYPC